MKLIPPDKYVNKGYPKAIVQQLEIISDFDNKIDDLLLEKITELLTENKKLKEINKKSQIELESLKTSMRNSQKDVEHEKVNFKMLQLKNKNLLLKLQNINKLMKSNDVDHSEELPRKKRKLLNENNIVNTTYSTVEGMSVV